MINDALANLQTVIAKHAGKNLLNLGELKETIDAQSDLLIALAHFASASTSSNTPAKGLSKQAQA